MPKPLLRFYYCLLNPRLFLPYFRKFIFKKIVKNADYLWETEHNLYEIEVCDYMRRVLREGDVFIDVGSNIGYFEGIVSELVGESGHIYAFEPQPIKVPPHKNITFNQLACGARNEKVKLLVAGGLGTGSSIVKEFLEYNALKVEKEIEVAMVRLDDYIKERRIGDIKLIKIDVESYEFEVLKGLSGYFDAGNRPIIICEVHGFEVVKAVFGKDIKEFMGYMASYGYEAYNIWLPDQKVDLTRNINIGNIIFRSK